MKRAPFRPSSAAAVTTSRTGRRSFRAIAAVAVAALALGACGGDDDDDPDDAADTTDPETEIEQTDPPGATTTTAAPATTVPATTLPPEPEYVTEGAIVVVANASGVNGAAGRMSDRLAAVGFETGAATNSTEGQLETTKIYYDPDNDDALPVAESLREALGGGDIQLFELGVPAPVDDGEIGDASIVVAMGNDTADHSLDELQGRAPATDDDDTDDEDTDDGDTDDGDDGDGDDGDGDGDDGDGDGDE